MEDWLYNSLTIGFFVSVVVSSLLIPGVTVVFAFVSAFAISTLCFTLPGLCYVLSTEKFPSHNLDESRTKIAYCYIVIGVFLFLFLTANEIAIIIR